MPLLSLVTVNFNASGHLLRCVESLKKQEPPAGVDRAEEWLELLVVDNASRAGDRALLATLPPKVHVLYNDENLGYARAINQGIEQSRGEFVGFLNPDVLALPGALAALLEALRAKPEVGAVGPRTWWDEDRTFWLPLLPPTDLAEYLWRLVANVVPPYGRRMSRRRARWTAALWAASAPTPVRNLAGSFLLTRRSALESTGGFDPRFHLYFEDTDWCRRLRGAGYRLLYVPAAEIVHFYNQSAQQVARAAGDWLVRSERIYLEKHYGPVGVALHLLSRKAVPWLVRAVRPGPVPAPVDLGRARSPLTLDCSGLPLPLVFQISLHWLFLDAAFTRWSRPTCPIPPAVWERLEPIRYYARALDPVTFQPLRMWTWEKS